MDAATRAALLRPRRAGRRHERVPGVRDAGRLFRDAAAEGDAQRRRLGAARRRRVLPVRDRVQHHDHDDRRTRFTRSVSPEVARIGAEMDRILRTRATPKARVGERMRKLAKSPAQLYPDTDEGRAQMLEDYQAIIDEITRGPRPVLRHQAQGRRRREARAAVRGEDGARRVLQRRRRSTARGRGRSSPTCATSARRPKFGMRTLAYHEAVPGPSFADRDRAGNPGPAVLPQRDSVHRVRRRLGALRRAARVGGRLREGSARQPRPPAGRDVPRRAPRRRHRHPQPSTGRASRRSTT